MRKSILTTLGILLSFLSFSQDRIDIGLNANIAFPVSDFGFGDKDNPFYIPPGMGVGGSLEGNFWFSEKFSAGIEAGYLSFMDEATTVNASVFNTSATAVPIVAKVTFYMGQGKVRPYFEFGAGYCLYTQKQSSVVIDGFLPLLVENTWDQSGALVSPRFGLLANLTDRLALKVNVQYNQMFNTIDGDHTVEQSINGMSTTGTVEGLYANSVGYVGVNIGVTFALFDYFDVF